MGADQREWDDLARRDAMWAICSIPHLRGSWSPGAFFESGEAEVAGILAGLEEHGLSPASARALDFGCGLGRLTRALASRFDAAVGVDISPEMVAEARRLNADLPGLRFEVNERPDLSLLGEERFDFVLSLIALQHAASHQAIRGYLAELVRVTAPEGILVLQLPTRVARRVRHHPLRVLNRAVRRLPNPPETLLRALLPHSMRLLGLPEPEVTAILTAAGGDVVTSFPDRRGGSDLVPSRVYVVRRQRATA